MQKTRDRLAHHNNEMEDFNFSSVCFIVVLFGCSCTDIAATPLQLSRLNMILWHY